MDYEPIQIEHGDNLHFYRITPQGMWLWKRKHECEDIELIFGINIPDGRIDSTPFFIRSGFGSFKMFAHTLQEAKDIVEYQLNMQLLIEPFEAYEAMLLPQIISGEL